MSAEHLTPNERKLRLAVLFASALGTLFWLGSLYVAWTGPSRNGFEAMAVALATIYFVALVLPALILGLIGRWLIFAAILGVVVVVLATDALWPWFPWTLFDRFS